MYCVIKDHSELRVMATMVVIVRLKLSVALSAVFPLLSPLFLLLKEKKVCGGVSALQIERGLRDGIKLL